MRSIDDSTEQKNTSTVTWPRVAGAMQRRLSGPSDVSNGNLTSRSEQLKQLVNLAKDINSDLDNIKNSVVSTDFQAFKENLEVVKDELIIVRHDFLAAANEITALAENGFEATSQINHILQPIQEFLRKTAASLKKSADSTGQVMQAALVKDRLLIQINDVISEKGRDRQKSSSCTLPGKEPPIEHDSIPRPSEVNTR